MKNTIAYVTGNNSKFLTGKHFLSNFGIDIEQKILDIPEIQSDDVEQIAKDKAEKAFEIVKAPIFVNDSGWYIEALNGFPGPFMKYLNHWFSPQDFLNLMNPYSNRKVVLRQVVVYKDGKNTQVFIHDAIGKILTEARGKSKIPSNQVISLSFDGSSIAENAGEAVWEIEEPLWQEFADWIKQNG